MSSLMLAEAPDFIKARLAKSELFCWLKDGCVGTNEKNAIHITNKWLKQQGYERSDEEYKVIRNGYLTIMSFTSLGCGFPSICLFAPSMRAMIWNTKLKRCLFGGFCATIGYINYNSAHQTLMYNLLSLNNSPYAYCLFQIACLPEYKRLRNKWQSAYNLSAVAHRYADFDLHRSLSIKDSVFDIEDEDADEHEE